MKPVGKAFFYKDFAYQIGGQPPTPRQYENNTLYSLQTLRLGVGAFGSLS